LEGVVIQLDTLDEKLFDKKRYLFVKIIYVLYLTLAI